MITVGPPESSLVSPAGALLVLVWRIYDHWTDGAPPWIASANMAPSAIQPFIYQMNCPHPGQIVYCPDGRPVSQMNYPYLRRTTRTSDELAVYINDTVIILVYYYKKDCAGCAGAIPYKSTPGRCQAASHSSLIWSYLDTGIFPMVVRPLCTTLYHFICGRSLSGDFGNTFSYFSTFVRLFSLLHFTEISVLLM